MYAGTCQRERHASAGCRSCRKRFELAGSYQRLAAADSGSRGRAASAKFTAIPPQPSGGSAGANTGLGGSVDAVASKSPALSRDVASLRAAGWTIRYGTTTETGSFTDRNRSTIVINANYQSDPVQSTRSLSHEVGHAQNPTSHVVPSGLTRDEYVKKNVNADLAGEGAATLNNAKVRDEIRKNGGPDISISGTKTKKYESIYKQYSTGKITRAQAEQRIGQAFGAGEKTSTTNQNYRAYYGQSYRRNWSQMYPNKPKNFRAP
jgi:type VI secretion system secreted protein VgrG